MAILNLEGAAPQASEPREEPVCLLIFSPAGLGHRGFELLWIGFITCVFFLLLRGSNPLALKILLGLLALGNLIFLALVINNYLVWRRIRKRDSQDGD